jgi:ATP-binding cassette subfamily B protein
MKSSSKILKRVLSYSKPYLIYLILTIVFSLASVIFGLYSTILIGEGIDCIVGVSNVNKLALAIVIYKFVIVIICIFITEWMVNLCTGKLTYYTIRDIRQDAIKNLQIVPLKTIDGHSHGDILDRIVSDVDIISNGLLMGFTQLFSGIVTIVATLAFMFYFNYKIALLVVLATPLSLFVASYIAKKSYVLFRKQSACRGKMTAFVEEMIGNQKTVKCFSQEQNMQDKYEVVNNEYKIISTKAVFMGSTTNPSTRFINNLIYAGVGLLGAFQVIATASSPSPFTVGKLSSFLIYANKYTKPFNEISSVVAELQSAISSASRVFEIIDLETQTPDIENAIKLNNIKGKIEIDNVNFSYEPEDKLINNFNLKVDSGQKIAIVGRTGCGKTTLINLLMRFYEVDSGVIKLEGIPIININRNSLRNSYGMVLQDTFLKTGTVFENIAYGKKDATIEEVEEVAKKVHAHSFIIKLANGYNTVISNDTSNISQGQKQLLCIARVMLIDPPMLILDEATSSIDSHTEIVIQKAFEKLMEGRTSFIIAHRLSTIRDADCILVMDKGHIIEQGNHKELLEKKGFYYNLFEKQVNY